MYNLCNIKTSFQEEIVAMSEEMKNRVRLNSYQHVFSYDLVFFNNSGSNVDIFDVPGLLYTCRKKNCSERLT